MGRSYLYKYKEELDNYFISDMTFNNICGKIFKSNDEEINKILNDKESILDLIEQYEMLMDTDKIITKNDLKFCKSLYKHNLHKKSTYKYYLSKVFRQILENNNLNPDDILEYFL